MEDGTTLRIEAMTMDDLPCVMEIERASFSTPWPHDSYRHELRENRVACYLVARDGPEIVGYAGMWVILEEAHVTTIAVDPTQRRRRIGERLLVALIEETRSRGGLWLTLEVRKSNVAAQALYKKYGFREVHVRKRYYTDNGEDALIMWTGNLWESPFKERFQELKDSLRLSEPAG